MPTPECNIQLLERRVDTLTREVVDEIKGQKAILKDLIKDVDGLKNDKTMVKGYLAGAASVITLIGIAIGTIISNVTGWKI